MCKDFEQGEKYVVYILNLYSVTGMGKEFIDYKRLSDNDMLEGIKTIIEDPITVLEVRVQAVKTLTGEMNFFVVDTMLTL